MKGDQKKWDLRYQTRQYPTHPSPILTEFFSLASPGKALDIATGNGRNAFFLSQNHFQVDAVDISKAGFDRSKKDYTNINFIHHDLDHFQIEQNHYNIIVNVNFLDRNLFSQIINALKKDALLIFQTFLKPLDSIMKNNKSTKSHYLLPNELLNAFKDLQIVYYSEDKEKIINDVTIRFASLIARKS
jgi:tellurite methyltransferase